MQLKTVGYAFARRSENTASAGEAAGVVNANTVGEVNSRASGVHLNDYCAVRKDPNML